MSEKKSKGKTAALVTNIIALLALVAGLLLPITNHTFSGGGFDFKESPVMQAAGALASLGLNVDSGVSDLYYFPIAGGFDLGSALLLFYILTVFAAVILLVPALVLKAEKARKVIFVSELIALSSLLPFCMLEILKAGLLGEYATWNLNIIGAFAITLLMLVIQCIIERKGSGALKLILFLLSGLAASFVALGLASAVPALSSAAESAADAVSGKKPFETGTGLFSVSGATVNGRDYILLALYNMFGSFRDAETSVTVANWLGFVISALVLLNLFLDMFGLGKKTNRFMIISNVARYSAELASVVALAITILFMTASYGVMLYLLAAIAIIQFVIQTVRAVVYKKTHRAAKPAEETESEALPAGETAPAALPAAETALASSDPSETRSYVYNVNTIYNGPTDEFINKLSTEQKVEFARMFLEKRTPVNGIPDYVVGGDNSRFFSMLLIYFVRMRDLVSDGLMNKFYEEAKLM